MARLQSIRRPIRRFAQVDSRRRILVVEAAVLLLLARLALVIIPFPQLMRRLGTFVRPNDARVVQAGRSTSHNQARSAEDVGWAVTRAARYVPFNAVCLPQAIAARIMLKRRDVSSVLHFGAGRGLDNPLEAHAWLNAAGVEVTGYPVAKNFAEIGCFV